MGTRVEIPFGIANGAKGFDVMKRLEMLIKKHGQIHFDMNMANDRIHCMYYVHEDTKEEVIIRKKRVLASTIEKMIAAKHNLTSLDEEVDVLNVELMELEDEAKGA